MLSQEKYFDEIFEYVDLWSAGYVKAHLPNLKTEERLKLKNKVITSLVARIDSINLLRASIGLKPMNVNETYDYYINNILEFNDALGEIDFYGYDEYTAKIDAYTKSLRNPASAEAYLLVIGAPDIYIQNHHVEIGRVDIVNRMLKDGGYPLLTPQKTEELLLRILVVNN
ncbi:MAG TPA: hypothetical protein DIV86_02835 [Alphaproteobacteria bacterium]|nr:hypothetical protein [Alphaproteobacteria bacterium]